MPQADPPPNLQEPKKFDGPSSLIESASKTIPSALNALMSDAISSFTTDVKPTKIYTHVLNRGLHDVQSPLDRRCPTHAK